MSLALEWPGEVNISYVVIDPTTKRVFSSDIPLPVDCQKLNTFENRYVKITEVFDLFSGPVRDDAKWVLQELLDRFNVKQLVNVSSMLSETTTYLPITTLLAFVMIWPCCKAFQSLYMTVHHFLENSPEALCCHCGWTRRECNCSVKGSDKKIKTFIGYVKSTCDAACQTEFVEATITVTYPESNMSPRYQGDTPPPSSPSKEGHTPCKHNLQDSESHLQENTDLITNNSKIRDNSHSSVSSRPTFVADNVNYVQPMLHSDSDIPNTDLIQECSNIFNLTSQGYHVDSGKSLKRKHRNHDFDIEPNAKKAKYCDSTSKLQSPSRPSEKISGNAGVLSEQEFSPGAPNMILNLRGAGDKNGETSFWRLVDDLPSGQTGERGDLVDPLGKMFKRFRHTVFGDVVLRCLIQNCGQCFDTQKAVKFHVGAHSTSENCHDKSSQAYRCTECSFQAPFTQWYTMIRHMETSHGLKISSGENSCCLCGLTFEDKEGLEHHMEFHSNSHYRCMYCGITLFSWHQVEMHLTACNKRMENPKDQKLDIGCPYCPTVFQKKNVRLIHLMSHMDEGLTCMFCEDKISRTWKALKKHYDLKHAKQVKKLNSTKVSKKVELEPSTCSKCCAQFRNFEVYTEHMTKFHQWVPYIVMQCPHCDKRFNSEKSLNWHVKELHTPDLSCGKCSFATTSSYLLKNHMNQKHASSDYSCTACHLSFNGHRQLRMHMARHALNATFHDQEFNRHFEPHNRQYQDHGECLEKISKSYDWSSSLKTPSTKMQVKESFVENVPLDQTVRGMNDYSEMNESNSKIIPNGSSVGKRGRKKKIVMTDTAAVQDEDKREKTMKLQKDLLDKMRAVLRDSSARTRSYEDFKIIRSLRFDSSENHSDVVESKLASSPSTASLNDDSICLLPSSLADRYPLIDHLYCKLDSSVAAENVIAPVQPTTSHKHHARQDKKNKPVTRASSPSLPETPVAENCTAFPLRTTRRQAAIAASKEQVSHCYAPPDINSSIVAVHNPLDDWDLDSMTSKMSEPELLAENELLKGLGDYVFMQDMLTSLSPSKNKKATSVCGFVVPPDLETIELTEEDLELFNINENDLYEFVDHFVSEDLPTHTSSNEDLPSVELDLTSAKANHRENGKMQQTSQLYM